MDDDESGQMGYQHNAEIILDKVSPMTMSSMYGSGWDPMVASYPLTLETQGISSSSHLVNYPSNPNLAQMLPRVPVFGARNFPEIIGAYGNSNPLFPQNYASNVSGLDVKPSTNAMLAERDCQSSEGNGKRKRDYDLPSPPNKNAEGDPLKDHSSETSCPKEQDAKRQNSNEKNTVGKSSGKQAGKQAVIDDSQCEGDPKQDYIHVRARRGQATNSHSLAERLRREKISERMRLLQELVPGCSKITGKAVMLDEIINYVQSLQQQVEFLSMKLATVNPELNLDIERILSKDALHSRGSGAPILGFDQGMGPSHGFTQGIHQACLTTMPNGASQYHNMPQAVWDSDLQSLLYMGFDSNSAVGNLGPNGSSKTEL